MLRANVFAQGNRHVRTRQQTCLDEVADVFERVGGCVYLRRWTCSYDVANEIARGHKRAFAIPCSTVHIEDY